MSSDNTIMATGTVKLHQPLADVRIYEGDVRDALREIPDESVQCVVTSPPYYGLRNYGVDGQIGLESTVEEYVQTMVEVFREVRRVLRKDGTLWLNLGDSYNGSGGAGGDYGPGGLKEGQPKYPGRKLNGLKLKDLIGVPWRVAFALQADGWYLRSDIIWCLSGGTRVYAKTQKGEMPMTIKDLVRLDPMTVKLWNGRKWTQVLGWSLSPRPDLTYEIELRSGERIGCTAGHVWPTQRGNIRADELKVGDIIQTCRLPEPENAKHPGALDDDLVGWFVGLYIAEGSRSGDTIQIASHIKEIKRFERLQRLAEAYDGTCHMHHTGGNSATINLDGPILNGILDAYVAGETAHNKHLNPRCWQRSDAFLFAVLDGYLSGDGYYDQDNGRYRIGFTENDDWAADLRTICARLGCSMRLKRVKHKLSGKEFPGYRGQIRMKVSSHHNNRPDSEVVAIRRSRARHFWDIAVEDEPHLFALASGVLTHNSKPNPMPESVTDRPTKAHEYIFLLSKSPQYFYDADAIREEYADDRPLRQSQTWEERKAKGQRSNNRALGSTAGMTNPGTLGGHHAGRNKRSVWTVATVPFPEAHFATYPPALIEPCILAGTSPMACPHCGAPWKRVVEVEWGQGEGKPYDSKRPDGLVFRDRNRPSKRIELGWQPTCSCEDNDGSGKCVVLDPFHGSGTTMQVALQLGRAYVGCELNPEYIEMSIRTRLRNLQPTLLGRLG